MGHKARQVWSVEWEQFPTTGLRVALSRPVYKSHTHSVLLSLETTTTTTTTTTAEIDIVALCTDKGRAIRFTEIPVSLALCAEVCSAFVFCYREKYFVTLSSPLLGGIKGDDMISSAATHYNGSVVILLLFRVH